MSENIFTQLQNLVHGATRIVGMVPAADFDALQEQFEDLERVSQAAFRRLQENAVLEHWADQFGIDNVCRTDLGDGKEMWEVGINVPLFKDRFEAMGWTIVEPADIETDITDKVMPNQLKSPEAEAELESAVDERYGKDATRETEGYRQPTRFNVGNRAFGIKKSE